MLIKCNVGYQYVDETAIKRQKKIKEVYTYAVNIYLYYLKK